MKVLYRFPYLLLILTGSILFVIIMLLDPIIWALIGKSPACCFFDHYTKWLSDYKKSVVI